MRNKIKRLSRRDKKLWISDHLQEDFRGGPAEKWQQIKRLRKGYQPRPPNIRNDQGKLVPPEQRAETLAAYLSTSVWSPSITQHLPTSIIYDTADINLQPFTMFELKFILHQLKTKRAPGTDQIPSEFWKWANEDFLCLLLQFYNRCFIEGTAPDKWDDAIFAMLPKPNQKDPHAPGATRPICLTQTTINKTIKTFDLRTAKLVTGCFLTLYFAFHNKLP